MINVAYIKENQQEVAQLIKRRGLPEVDLEKLIALDEQRLALTNQQNKLQAEHNAMTRAGKPTPETIEKGRKLRAEVDKLSTQLLSTTSDLNDLLSQIPNQIAEGTPEGGEENNVEVFVSKTPKNLSFSPRDHLALNEIHEFVNFEAGSAVAQNKFYFLQDKGVRLWLALVQFTTKFATEHGFELMMVPHMVKSDIASAMGFLPRGEERQIYKVEDDDLNLIATAELPLTGYFRNQIIDVTTPRSFAGLSSCYRVEAGTYGKFAKGLYRVHQFEKLELYVFCKAPESDHQLKRILEFEKLLYDMLEIPYRVVRIAEGDMGAPHYEKYDLEYWAPADQMYRELTSCSNCTDYQTQRLNIRYKDENGKNIYAHSLNGTAITSSRSLIAILENHQNEDGSISIPAVLQPYYGGDTL